MTKAQSATALATIQSVFACNTADGIFEGSEPYEVCSRAVRFMGSGYRRSEELTSDDTTDCSTLVSQAHWEGAAIIVPFTAERQRVATSGKMVASVDEMMPGDVLVKYPSVEESPDHTMNHVGLYLGRDHDGLRWLIEAESATGVRLSTLSAFAPKGGIRRFVLTSQPFPHGQANPALSAATKVPKLGRLGARQYLTTNGGRRVHRGIDIYVPAGTAVIAPSDGVVRLYRDGDEWAAGVEVLSEGFVVRLQGLQDISVASGQRVATGSSIGIVCAPSSESDVRYSSGNTGATHLHVEVESKGLDEEVAHWSLEVDGKRYLNPLYVAKVGKMSLPIKLT